jgi:hypothetical protein
MIAMGGFVASMALAAHHGQLKTQRQTEEGCRRAAWDY